MWGEIIVMSVDFIVFYDMDSKVMCMIFRDSIEICVLFGLVVDVGVGLMFGL